MSQSLYKIESELAELLEIRQELISDLAKAEASHPDLNAALVRDAIAATEAQLAELFGAEVRKVDGIRAVWAHLEMVAEAAGDEAKRQQDRKRTALAQLDRLKTGVQSVMEMMPWREGKPRKIEGQTGALYLKQNGGRQAVEVSDESLVPDEYCTVTVTMPSNAWPWLLSLADRAPENHAVCHRESFRVGPRVPSLSAIGGALEKPCGSCGGDGVARPHLQGEKPVCTVCGGSGKAGVPGARLAPRGQHVEVR